MYRNMIAKKFWIVMGVSSHTGDVYTLSHPMLKKEEADALAKKLDSKMGRSFSITVEERDVDEEITKK